MPGGSLYTATGEGEEALAAATQETVLLLAGSTTRKGKGVVFAASFDGTASGAEPVLLRVKRGNSASQGTSTAATEEKHDPDDPAASCTAFHSFTVEPTYTGQPLREVEVHPQGGQWYEQVVLGPFALDDATNSFLGLTCTAPAIVNVAAFVDWEE